METHLEILSQIKQLDFKKYPYLEIKDLIDRNGGFAIACEGLYPGDELIRARPNEEGKSYTCRKDLSYVPKELNQKYQRASTPNKSMFYGCPLKRNHLKRPKEEDINDLRFRACIEVSDLLKNDTDGEEIITFSRWAVTKTMSLSALYCHKEFIIDDSHENEMHQIYLTELGKIDNQSAKKFLDILTFFSDEFAKEIKNDARDYNYMISAIFSEMMVESGKAGIYYPSVKTKFAEKIGFNVAISPEVTETSLKLLSSIECTLYKRGKEVFIDEDRVAFIIDNENRFEYEPVKAEYHSGKEAVLKFLETERIRKQKTIRH